MSSLLASQRMFRRYALSFAVTRAGDYLLSVAMVVFVYQRTQSSGWVAAAATARLVPHILFSSTGGRIGNQFGRRFLVVSDVTRALLNTALVAAALVGSLPGVVVLSVLAQVAGAGYGATTSALVPRLVPDAAIAEANATIGAIESVSLLAGPALGGVILAVASPVLAFSLNAGSFILSALVVATLRLQPPTATASEETLPGAPRHDVPARQRDGFSRLLATQEMRAVTLAAVGANLVIGVFSVMFVVVSVGALGMGASGTGFLFAAFGAGGVAGAVTAGRTIHRASARRWVGLMLAATGLALGAMAGARTPLLALLLAAAAGGTGAFLEVLSITKVQGAFPHDTATVCGALDSLSYTSVLLGLLLAPLLVALVGAVGCLLVVGAGLLLLAAAIPRHTPAAADPAGVLVQAPAVS